MAVRRAAIPMRASEKVTFSVFHESCSLSNCFLTYWRKNLIPRRESFCQLGIELKPSKMPFESSEKIKFPSTEHAPFTV
jgi:hypothetical protein